MAIGLAVVELVANLVMVMEAEKLIADSDLVGGMGRVNTGMMFPEVGLVCCRVKKENGVFVKTGLMVEEPCQVVKERLLER